MLDAQRGVQMIPVIYMTLVQIVIFGVVVGIVRSSSIIFLSGCIFIGSLTCFMFLGRFSGEFPSRKTVWFTARWTCVMIWFGSLVGYSLYYFTFPQSFSFSKGQLFFIAPLISFAPALMSIILTMCAGDTALFIHQKDER